MFEERFYCKLPTITVLNGKSAHKFLHPSLNLCFISFLLFFFPALSCIYFQEPPSLSLYLFQIQTAVTFSHYLSNFQESPLFLSLYHALSFLFKCLILSFLNDSSLYLKCSLLFSTDQSICISLSFLYVRLLSLIFKCLQSFFSRFLVLIFELFLSAFQSIFSFFFPFHNVSSFDILLS